MPLARGLGGVRVDPAEGQIDTSVEDLGGLGDAVLPKVLSEAAHDH